jgi:xanthine dehydrogenase accessory factor
LRRPAASSGPQYRIGDRAKAGETVAQIESTIIAAPLDGVLRGLVRDGVAVLSRTEVIEIDLRGDSALVRGVGARPGRIADAVVAAVSSRIPAVQGGS